MFSHYQKILFIYLSSLLFSFIYAAEYGQFQFILPVPDPVQAGEEVTFQILAVNTGAEIWKSGEYVFEVEIYDEEKKFLQKTKPITPDKDVKPGENNLVFIPFLIPNIYRGVYFFKASLTLKTQRIVYTDFLPFNVTPLIITPKPAPKFKIGGNSIASYKDEVKKSSVTTESLPLGNFSLNIIGSVVDNAFSMNLYTNHNKQKSFDIYNVIFNFYGRNTRFSLGDVMPAFSDLTLLSLGQRGIDTNFKFDWLSMSVVASRTQEAKQPTATTSGSFSRYLLGGRTSINLPVNIKIGVSYINSFDDESSIANPKVIQPVKDEVQGLDVEIKPFGFLIFKTEFAQSKYLPNIKFSTAALKDTAIGFDTRFDFRRFGFQFKFKKINPEFYSLGSPTILRDRNIIDLNSRINLKFTSINLVYNTYIDNLKKEKAKTTTKQEIYNTSIYFNFKKIRPGISISYNNLKGYTIEPSTETLNNYTLTYSPSISFYFTPLIFSITFLNSDFTDVLKKTHNLNTQTNNLNLRYNFKEFLSMSFGYNSTNIQDKEDKSINKSNTFIISLNGIITKNLNYTFWSNISDSLDNDLQTKKEIKQNSFNLELTYSIIKSMSFTIGGGVGKYIDILVSQNSYSETKINTRISIGF